MRTLSSLLSLLALAGALPARASSDDAWAAFRADVTRACTAQAKKNYADAVVVVDAFGSASYGFALVYAHLPAPKGAMLAPGLATIVCVYDKKTKKAELSGEFRTVNP
jgi:hypothetical protein